MKIAIHNVDKESFSPRWIEYCTERGIPFKQVDLFSNNIIEQLSDCDYVMWHHNHVFPKDVLVARQILNALESSGKKVFPDFNTAWHFDDKLAQKYLLESIGAPLVPVYISFSKQEALQWVKNAKFPKIFKLRGGGGSKNVWLIKDRTAAERVINTAFRKGFRQYNAWRDIIEQFRKYNLGKTSIKEVIKAFVHLIYPIKLELIKPRERGYIYFQDYLPGNKYDIRIVVVGDKAFGIKRLVRENDFRASGSGHIVYERNEIDLRCVKLAFDLNRKLKSQSLAFDFILDQNNVPKLLEVSYGFTAKGYDPCPGYWNIKMEWKEGRFNPYAWMIEDLIASTGTLK